MRGNHPAPVCARAGASIRTRFSAGLLTAVAGLLLLSGQMCAPADPVDNLNVRDLAQSQNGAISFAEDPVIQLRQMPEHSLSHDLPDGPRHYLLGAVPIGAPSPILTDDDVYRSIATVATFADCFVIRQKIDWEAYRPGGSAFPELTESIVHLWQGASESGFTSLLVELDPIVDRHHIGPLPPAIEDHDFSSPDVRTAFRRQALEVAARVKPRYLSFGVEVNGYYESNPDDFANFVSLHQELYDEVKAISPDTQIMASFNLEALQGLLAQLGGFSDHPPYWFLIDRFEPKIDAVAFSTLPFPVFYEPSQIPLDYLSRIQTHTDLPIVLSEVGWHSYEPGGSNQAKQHDYLVTMIRRAAFTPNLRVFAWTIMYDAADGSVFDSFPDFKFLGMLSWDGNPKEALATWKALYDVPYVPPQE